MLIRFGHQVSVTCPAPTPMVALVNVHAQHGADLLTPERLSSSPEVAFHSYFDLFGNLCRRFVAPEGGFSFGSDATVRDDGAPDPVDWSAKEIPVAALPDETLMYLMGSRYIETDRLSQMAWDLFAEGPHGWGRVQAICDWVHQRITFDYMQARATRTAFEAAEERVGVCRDFAHLAIGLTRAMNIPARYVNGYIPDIGVPYTGPMDFAAWMEVYLGGRWCTFDPRNNMPRVGRIVVARGRDAADVPLINSFGPHEMTGFTVWCDEVESTVSNYSVEKLGGAQG